MNLHEAPRPTTDPEMEGWASLRTGRSVSPDETREERETREALEELKR